MLALVMGAVLSMCASAWATVTVPAVYLHQITPEYTTVSQITERTGKQFTIRVRASILSGTNSGTNANNITYTYSTTATHIGWIATNSDGTPVTDLVITDADSSRNSFTADTLTNGINIQAYLTGTIAGEGTVTVTATLLDADGNTANGTTANTNTSTTVEFDASAEEDVLNDDFIDDATLDTEDTPDLIDGDSHDPRDPDSAEWNGLDPVFLNAINTDSYDYGKTKPALGKVDKANLTFKGGTSKDLKVPLTGPIEELDVYIAAKDAIKLGWLEKGATDNISLTSDNIKAYNIPFRVTSYDLKSSVKGSTAKDLAKNWKAAASTVTLSFNGGNVQYKGLPITFAMTNGNTSSKPVAKALKFNVEPNTTEPAWTTEVLSTDYFVNKVPTYYENITLTEDEATAWLADDTSADVVQTAYKYILQSDDNTPAGPLAVTYNDDGSYANEPEDDNKTYVAQKYNGVLCWFEKAVDYYYWVKDHSFYADQILTKKDKPEITVRIFPDAEDDADKGGDVPSTIYTVSADGPYTITAKAPKDEAITITIAQASFDYLGKATAPGYVKIGGEMTNKDKENKQAITLTVTNPSTKKKAALKVTVIGKTAPVYEKAGTFTFDADDETTHKRYATKRVEAGKAPSAKFKAKGSKTISYMLGAYTYEEDEDGNLELVPDDTTVRNYLYDYVHGDDDDYEYDYSGYDSIGAAFNAELVEKLTAKKLSFDAKKGAVVLLKKGTATLPTLNEAGDAFESLDIVVTAVNSAGTDQAWAHLGITGAKPKVADKSVTFKGAVKKGDIAKFKLMAGKVAAEKGTADNSSNVIATAGDGAEDALADLGLALVTYDNVQVLTDATVTFAAGATIPAYSADKNTLVSRDEDADVESGSEITSEEVEVKSGDEVIGTKTVYTAAVAITLVSGEKWVTSTDESLKNYGLIQVTNPATLAEAAAEKKNNSGISVNLILDNFGATAKGKIKVAIDAKATNGGDPATNGALPASNGALPANNAAAPAATAKTNGTASLTYNGALPDADADESAEVESVTIGSARTAADLTAGQQAFLAENGLKVIAVLPEITANAEGQQEFAVELDEDAPEGAKMVYVPFPQNAEETEDDKIADFYGADGEAIEEVPADKNITAAPWLREGVTYQPVIAAEDAE